MIRSLLLPLALLGAAIPADAHEDAAAEQPSAALLQLRHVIGTWDVVTTFFRDDGSVAGTAEGTYTFDWAMEDETVVGVSEIPQFGQASGLLFYIRESTGEIEMVSVGPDGQLWVMTGDIDSEVRETPVVAMADGTTLKLRFTRFNVEPDRFESRMDRSADGGETWVQGNHQSFSRRVEP